MLNFFSICQYSAKALSCGSSFNFCCVIFGITLSLAFKIKFWNEKNSEDPLNWVFHKYMSTLNNSWLLLHLVFTVHMADAIFVIIVIDDKIERAVVILPEITTNSQLVFY